MKKRIAKLTQEAMDALFSQRQAFIDKFGREPRSDDPVFFDPDSDIPAPMSESVIDDLKQSIIEAAKKCNLDPARALRTFGF